MYLPNISNNFIWTSWVHRYLMLENERRKWWDGLQYQLPATPSSRGQSKIIVRGRDPLTVGRSSLNATVGRAIASKNLRHLIFWDGLEFLLKLSKKYYHAPVFCCHSLPIHNSGSLLCILLGCHSYLFQGMIFQFLFLHAHNSKD